MHADCSRPPAQAKALVKLLTSDEASKMVALDAIAVAAKGDRFEGHGWSLSYPMLRHLLQGAAERLLHKESEGSSAAGIAYALNIGHAVEFAADWLERARATFDASQVRVRCIRCASAQAE